MNLKQDPHCLVFAPFSKKLNFEIFFQIQLHSQSQEKVFPHEKAQLKLNYEILQNRFQRYQQEQIKVKSCLIRKARHFLLFHNPEFSSMLTLESRRFVVLGEISFCIRTLPNR